MKCERCEREIPEELYSITERGLMLSATGHWAPFSLCKSCKKELDSWFFEYGKHRCDERMNDNENKTTLSAEKTTITDGDLISRESVKDLIRGLTKWGVRSQDGKFENVGLLYDDVMFGIDRLPSAEKIDSFIQQEDVADILNIVESALKGTNYEVVGYDNTDGFLKVLIDMK